MLPCISLHLKMLTIVQESCNSPMQKNQYSQHCKMEREWKGTSHCTAQNKNNETTDKMYNSRKVRACLAMARL